MKNKNRIITIFNRLENAKDKEDEQTILKQLAAEELLSPEQYNSLRQIDEINHYQRSKNWSRPNAYVDQDRKVKKRTLETV